MVTFWERSPLSPQQPSAIAEEIGACYLAGHLTYSLANGLMNQLMPLAGWERAPQRFWQFYVAFEDYETLAEPDPQARLAVQAALNAGAA